MPRVELEHERLRLDVVLAHGPAAEATRPHGGPAAVPTVHRLPPPQCSHVRSIASLSGPGRDEFRGPDLVGEQPVEGPLVHGEQLDFVLRPDGGASRSSAEQPELPEGLPATKRVEDLDVAGVRMLRLHSDRAAADHEERRRAIALPEDGLAGVDGYESNVPREVGEQILGQALERRKGVDELGRLDAPGRFAAEADPPDDREAPSPDGPQSRDASADHRTTDEQEQQDEQRPAGDPAVPQARQQPSEALAPEVRGTDQNEDREHRAQEPVHRETELLQREALTSSNLVPEIVLRELERAGA